MTREEAKVNAEIMLAYAEGKTIQTKGKYDNHWNDNNQEEELQFVHWGNTDYRIKPEPKYRPWKPEEVPVGAWIRTNTEFSRNHGYFSSIIGVSCKGVMSVEESVEEMFSTFEEAFNKWEHSTDKGQTWKVCGVLTN